MSAKIITATAAAFLLGSTAFASAQTRTFPMDGYYGSYYGSSEGYYGRRLMAPNAYAPGYYDYAPGYNNVWNGNAWNGNAWNGNFWNGNRRNNNDGW
jgi:hypothetical protein